MGLAPAARITDAVMIARCRLRDMLASYQNGGERLGGAGHKPRHSQLERRVDLERRAYNDGRVTPALAPYKHIRCAKARFTSAIGVRPRNTLSSAQTRHAR